MMERLAYLSEGSKVEADDLAFVNSPQSQEPRIAMDLPLADATRQFQCDYIQRHIERAKGQYDRCGLAHGAASLQSVSQNETVGHERLR